MSFCLWLETEEKKKQKEKIRLEREKRILENTAKWTNQILPQWDKMYLFTLSEFDDILLLSVTITFNKIK
jgi:hypothetical protein